MNSAIKEALDNKEFIQKLIANIEQFSWNTSPFNNTQYTMTTCPAQSFVRELIVAFNKHPKARIPHDVWTHFRNMVGNPDLLKEVPKEHVKDLLPKYLITKFKKTDRLCSPDTFNIRLDEFAFAMFEQWVDNKKLTSIQAVLMINQLKISDKTLGPVSVKYFNSIWEHTPKKSLELQAIAINETFLRNNPIVYELPFISISYQNIPIDTNLVKDISLSLHFYQTLINKYNLPVSAAIRTTEHSKVYQWITGVPKPTPLNDQGIEIAIDQLIVLNHMLDIKPQYAVMWTKLIDQLTAELKSNRYTNIAERVATRQQHLQILTRTYNGLI